MHVSEIGAPHLVDPPGSSAARAASTATSSTRSGASSRRCRQENIHTVGADVLGLACFPSPGHASHHVCYLDREGTLYAGDAAGVRIMPDRHVLPVAPPPDVDLDAWERTIDEIEHRAPGAARAHPLRGRRAAARPSAPAARQLRLWAQRVRQGMTEEEFVEAARADLEEEVGEAPYYERAAPLWQSYAGLKRYWDKAAADRRVAARTRS